MTTNKLKSTSESDKKFWDALFDVFDIISDEYDTVSRFRNSPITASSGTISGVSIRPFYIPTEVQNRCLRPSTSPNAIDTLLRALGIATPEPIFLTSYQDLIIYFGLDVLKGSPYRICSITYRQRFLFNCIEAMDPLTKSLHQDVIAEICHTPELTLRDPMCGMYSKKAVCSWINRLYQEWLGFIRRTSPYSRYFKSPEQKYCNIKQILLFLCQEKGIPSIFLLEPPSTSLVDDTLIWQDTVFSNNSMEALFHPFGPGPIPSSIRQAYKAYIPLYQRHLIAQQPKSAEYEKAPYIAYNTPSGRNQIILYDRQSKLVSPYSGQVFNAAPVPSVSLQRGITAVPAAGFLWDISDGKWNSVEDFARTLAYCFTVNKPWHGIILLGPNTIEPFIELIGILQGHTIYPYNQCVKPNEIRSRIAWLIQNKVHTIPVLRLDHDAPWPRTDDQKKLLRKLVTGKTITQDDKLLGKKKHRNIAQILMTGGDDVAAKIKNLGIPCWAPNFHSPNISNLQPDEIAWLRSVFLPWGLSKICGDQRKPRESPLNAFYLLDSFVRQRCVLSSELEVEARILYDAYATSCQDDILPPMKFKDFNSALEQQYSVRRYRPHYSRESNPYYFKGISLRTDYAIEQETLAADIFFDRIAAIEQEISLE